MAKIDLSKYGITGTTEIVYNPSYEMLFEEETKPELEGYEKGQVSELGAVNVMTGIYTGRSPSPREKSYVIIYGRMRFWRSGFRNGTYWTGSRGIYKKGTMYAQRRQDKINDRTGTV